MAETIIRIPDRCGSDEARSRQALRARCREASRAWVAHHCGDEKGVSHDDVLAMGLTAFIERQVDLARTSGDKAFEDADTPTMTDAVCDFYGIPSYRWTITEYDVRMRYDSDEDHAAVVKKRTSITGPNGGVETLTHNETFYEAFDEEGTRCFAGYIYGNFDGDEPAEDYGNWDLGLVIIRLDRSNARWALSEGIDIPERHAVVTTSVRPSGVGWQWNVSGYGRDMTAPYAIGYSGWSPTEEKGVDIITAYVQRWRRRHGWTVVETCGDPSHDEMRATLLESVAFGRRLLLQDVERFKEHPSEARGESLDDTRVCLADLERAFRQYHYNTTYDDWLAMDDGSETAEKPAETSQETADGS